MATVEKSRILNKIKKTSKGAWKRARSKEASARGQQLPGGLIRAVARFKSYKFGENDKKVPYVTLTGIVCEPAEYRGARASVTYRFESTDRRSIEDVIDNFSSDLQLLGAETEGTTEDDWESLLDSLVEAGPYYYFNTSAWEFNGRSGVSVFIQGPADDYETEEAEPEVEEEEAEEDEAPPAKPTRKPKAKPEPEPEPEEDEADEPEEEPEDEAEEDEIEPEVGDVWNYAAGKGSPKECEVTAVQGRAKTVTLKRIEDGKQFAKVPWDKLQGAE